MKLDLLPIFQNDEGLKRYLVTNFRRIQDLFETVEERISVAGDVAVGTGTLSTHEVTLADATGGAFTLTLLKAEGISQIGLVYRVQKIDVSANVVTVAADSTGTPDLIDGAASVLLAAQYDHVTLICTGLNQWSRFG